MIPILETEFVQLLLNQEKKTLRLLWKTNCSSESYRFTYKKVLDLTKKTEIHFFVSDISKLTLVIPSDRKWLQRRVLPGLYKSGIKKIAAVVAGDLMMQKHLAHLNKNADADRVVKQFGNLTEALKWFHN